MALYLGIDGGGTKTTCVVGDDESTLATATGEASNIVRFGEESARKTLHGVISQACSSAGVSPLRIASACIGAAGAASAETSEAVRRIVRQMLPNAEVQVVGDMVIASEAVLQGDPGVVVIAGTGSIAYGRNAAGETARAGGWGFAISDEGSGEWIGKQALRATMRSLDAQRKTILLERVCSLWKLRSRDELVRFANSTPAPIFAELFPIVETSADDGDEVARTVLGRAGEELAALVEMVIKRLWKPADLVSVGVSGGVFAHSEYVRHAFHNSLNEMPYKCSVSFEINDPAMGALWMARRAVSAMGAH